MLHWKLRLLGGGGGGHEKPYRGGGLPKKGDLDSFPI